MVADTALDYTSKMKAIGGTGAVIGARGVGSWTGSRSSELGSPVEADFTIRIHGIDIG